VILSKDYRSWGSFFYDPKNDLFRAKIPLRTIPMTLQNKANYDQGLKWIDQAIAQNNSFPSIIMKSAILTAMGKTADGDSISRAAIANSTEPELNLYGYQLLNGGEQERAIEMFILNTKRFPKSPNAFETTGRLIGRERIF
jgi:hypothetical protein